MSKTVPKKTSRKPVTSRGAEGSGGRSAAKPSVNKTKSSRQAAGPASRKAAAPPPVLTRRPTPQEIEHQHSLERFESALQLFSENQFGRARAMFAKLMEDPARELAERARVYVRICEQRLSKTAVQLKTAEDYYNYAVGLANQGDAEESEQHLQKALKLAPKADHIYYALATTYALRDDVTGALEYLGKAIELNERNRYQAQNDADFSNLLEDPRFTELLYPEKPS